MDKLSKEQVEHLSKNIYRDYGSVNATVEGVAVQDIMVALCGTILDFHTSIDTLADSFEAQGRVAEALAVRGLGE